MNVNLISANHEHLTTFTKQVTADQKSLIGLNTHASAHFSEIDNAIFELRKATVTAEQRIQANEDKLEAEVLIGQNDALASSPETLQHNIDSIVVQA